MTLFPFQEQALKETSNLNKVAYFWEMGTGKTFVGSEKLISLNESLNLLVCQKSKINDWLEHFEKHYPEVVIFDLTKAKQLEQFLFEAQRRSDTTVAIINYELLWRRSKIGKLSIGTLMLDESSLIQNSKAKQTKFILKLNYKNVILLSGTPCSGKYENLWTQLKLLGYGVTESFFLSTFVNFDLLDIGTRIVKVVRKIDPYKNEKRLKAKLAEYGARFLKSSDVIDLPEQVFTIVNSPVSSDYRRFLKTCIVQTDNRELVGNTNLTKRLYARMLCGQYSKEKLDSFKSLLESTQDRVLVFYNFNEELEELKAIAKSLDKPISLCNGSVKDFKAYDSEENSVTFLQYQAGAMGLNLQKANKVIYFTLPERSDLFEQSKKRVNRIGQSRTCFYYLMLCKGSIEESIYNALLRKEDYNDRLFKQEVLKINV